MSRMITLRLAFGSPTNETPPDGATSPGGGMVGRWMTEPAYFVVLNELWTAPGISPPKRVISPRLMVPLVGS